ATNFLRKVPRFDSCRTVNFAPLSPANLRDSVSDWLLLAIARRDYMLDREKWKEWSTRLQDPFLQSWSRLHLSRCHVVSRGISRVFTTLTNSYHASRRQSTQPR